MSRSKSRGTALLLSLWALFLLGALVMSWALDINSRLTVSGTENRIVEAEAMAASGAEIAMHPAIRPGSRNLEGKFGYGQTYSARLTENPLRIEMLRHYLEIKGIDLNERDRMIDCLLDWVSPSNLVHLNGAGESADYHPAHTLLTRIDDLKKVKGWEAFTAAPGWDEELTLNSSGPVDVAWASRDVLRALPGMTDELVDRFLQLRRGPDGVDATIDDATFKSLEDVRVAFGISPQQFQALSPFISFKDSILRVVSTGRSGDVTRVVQLVFRRAGTAVQLITWREF